MFRNLKAYQLAFRLAMEIFEESKNFPKEEKYSLTDQIRRASRSVAANIGGAIAKSNIPGCSLARWRMLTAKRPKLKCG